MGLLRVIFLTSLVGCWAKQPAFSIHDDLLSHPQFEVVFPESYVSEAEAARLIESARAAQPTHVADFINENGLTSTQAEHGYRDSAAGDGMPEVAEEFEIINTPPLKYLCSIPVLAQPAAQNDTATQLAQAEEARELVRASLHGWELMSGLDDSCLYFVAGWWSYKFCYGKDVVQFHALPNAAQGGYPIPDPASHEYILGRTLTAQPKSKHDKSELQVPLGSAGDSNPQNQVPPGKELQVKGDQRYLSQKLESGTICDLTGRPRTIEVQYHCNPSIEGDRIGWIKELTTCSYLMLVHTPRLCNDAAFRPPKPTTAHAITCRAIISSDADFAAWRAGRAGHADAADDGAAAPQTENTLQIQTDTGKSTDKKTSKSSSSPETTFKHTGTRIGNIIIGQNKLLSAPILPGQSPPKLRPPRSMLNNNNNRLGSNNNNNNGRAGSGTASETANIEVLMQAKSKAEGGKIEAMSREELEKLQIKPETLEQFRKELTKIAGEHAWRVELADVPGEGPEIRGIIDGPGDGEDGDGGEAGFYDEGGYDGYEGHEERADRGADVEGGEQGEGSEETLFVREEL